MTNTYSTGNPIGSSDPRDAYDNKSNFDEFALSANRFYTDRLGVDRKTITGALQDYAAYNPRGDWAAATAYNTNDIWKDPATGDFYFVPADYTSGASAAADIATGNVVPHQIKNTVLSIDTIADLRNLEPLFDGQQVELLGNTVVGSGGGVFYADFSSSEADDNGVTIVTAGGRRWKRKIEGYVTPAMFGLNTLDELQAQQEVNLADLRFKVYGGVELRNSRTSTRSLIDAPNFAGQTDYGNEPTAMTLHHYTDGRAVVIDNVGEGNPIVTLRNAQNPTRRPDKASNFVGTGSFLNVEEHDDDAGFSRGLFILSRSAELIWTGVKGIATLWQNKAEDGTHAFRLQTTNKHRNILNILNGRSSNVLNVGDDANFTRTRVESGPEQTNGLYLNATAGEVWLDGTQVRVLAPIRSNSGSLTLGTNDSSPVVTQVPLRIREYSSTSLPAAADFQYCTVSLKDPAGKPSPLVYSDGTNWRYMDNTFV